MELVFPKLVSYQQEVYDWLGDPYRSGKIAVIKSVRQCGKTFFLQIMLLRMAMEHICTSAIFEPTLSLARNVYKSIYKAMESTGMIKSANAQLLEIEFTNGSSILLRSTEQLNRGLTCTGLLVLDECAYLDDEAIYSILPLANVANAPILIASTPFVMGEGYFYEMYLNGLDEQIPYIKTFDWSKNKDIERFLTKEKKELYKQTMSMAKYTTEVEGEFLTDGGLLFQGLENVVGVADDSNVVYMGIDFATGQEGDYTALAVYNVNGEMLAIYRTNRLTPTQQVEWLSGLILDWAKDHTIRTILGEVNSIGEVYKDFLNQKLKVKQLSITEWTTTNKSKQDLVTSFQIAIENQRIKLLDNPNLLNECRKYQAEINIKTKSVTYNGYKCNDDMVIASMLGYYAYVKGMGQARIRLV